MSTCIPSIQEKSTSSQIKIVLFKKLAPSLSIPVSDSPMLKCDPNKIERFREQEKIGLNRDKKIDRSKQSLQACPKGRI